MSRASMPTARQCSQMPRNAWRMRWFFEVNTSRAASSIRITLNGFMPRRLIAFSTLVIGSPPPAPRAGDDAQKPRGDQRIFLDRRRELAELGVLIAQLLDAADRDRRHRRHRQAVLCDAPGDDLAQLAADLQQMRALDSFELLDVVRPSLLLRP